MITFNITDAIRHALGNTYLRGEILAAPSRRSIRPIIYQYSFNPNSEVAVVRGLRNSVVYYIRFFMMTGRYQNERRYFLNTLIKTGS